MSSDVSPWRRALAPVFVLSCAAASTVAQTPVAPSGVPQQTAPVPETTPALPQVPTDYVIGPDDVLTIFFWREKDLSGDVSVRPDGRISLPLLNDIEAAGLTPEQLRVRLAAAADKYIEEPTVTVVVKQINSRKVFITGQIAKPGAYPIMGPTTVLQLITMAGGVQEYSDDKNIQILRTENGRPVSLRFNYDEVKRARSSSRTSRSNPATASSFPRRKQVHDESSVDMGRHQPDAGLVGGPCDRAGGSTGPAVQGPVRQRLGRRRPTTDSQWIGGDGV